MFVRINVKFERQAVSNEKFTTEFASTECKSFEIACFMNFILSDQRSDESDVSTVLEFDKGQISDPHNAGESTNPAETQLFL